ncbi:MAG TPA: class III cytochrome c [Desulfobulbaceae bacterium]|nr:class III cytochrome c [Desulfobulbaceae bacterium]
MLNKLVVSVAVAAFLTVGAAVGAIAADKGPAEITLGASGKKPAVFPHAAHQEQGIACAECHHGMAADGKQTPYVDGMAIAKCDSCHNPEKLAGKTLGALKLDTLRGAGHGNCQTCHKAVIAKDSSKDKLMKCATCHSKK